MATNYKESLEEMKKTPVFAPHTKCPVLGTHQFFNITDPEACCFACGYKLRLY